MSEPRSLVPDWAAGAEGLARRALCEVAEEEQVGGLQRIDVAEDGVCMLRFAADVPGYPGWMWAAAVTRVEGHAPTVLEVELLPDEGALVPPHWVPWSQRFAEYRERRATELRERRVARTLQAAQVEDAAAAESEEDHETDSAVTCTEPGGE